MISGVTRIMRRFRSFVLPLRVKKKLSTGMCSNRGTPDFISRMMMSLKPEIMRVPRSGIVTVVSARWRMRKGSWMIARPTPWLGPEPGRRAGDHPAALPHPPAGRDDGDDPRPRHPHDLGLQGHHHAGYEVGRAPVRAHPRAQFLLHPQGQDERAEAPHDPRDAGDHRPVGLREPAVLNPGSIG